MKTIKRYIREPVSAFTHAAGALLALTGLIVLVYKGAVAGSISKIVAFSIFGASMVLLYTSSSLYHSLPVKKRTLKILQKLDHAMIYVLIAGTYTPVCLLVLHGYWRWVTLGIFWGIALTGILLKTLRHTRTGWASTASYLLMGWIGILLFPAMVMYLPYAFLGWMIAGGLLYTIGAIIFGLRKPNPVPEWFGSHEIWHLFVMGGTFAHFWAFYQFLT